MTGHCSTLLFLVVCRWGFYTHGGIDGFSRVIVFLRCTTSNRSEEVLTPFVNACQQYGLPSRVRSDHGGENFLVGVLMNVLRGSRRGSFITGRSVHNQRIERLWRDVHKEVTHTMYELFYTMEDSGRLDPDNVIHRFALHTVYLCYINSQLEKFRQAWNAHHLRTGQNKSPNQLWVEGMLHAANSGTSSLVDELHDGQTLCNRLTSRLVDMGVNPDTMNVEDSGSVNNTFTLTTEQKAELNTLLNTLADSDLDGRYDQCVQKLIEFSFNDTE